MKLNIVPATRGIQWVKLGIQTFAKQPLAIAGLFFMYMAAATLLSVLPLIGLFMALAIVPAATLGLMAATEEALKGRFPMPTVLISAFRAGKQRLRSMLVLGVVYAMAWLAILMLVQLFVDIPAPPTQLPSQPPTAADAVLRAEYQRLVLIIGACYLPVALMFWHAPALVHWHGVSPVKSLFFSTVACLRNWKAMLMFGLGWTGVIFAIGVVMTLVAVFTGNPQFAAAAVTPLGLLITPMFVTSLYFTFRDSFVATPDTELQAPGDSA